MNQKYDGMAAGFSWQQPGKMPKLSKQKLYDAIVAAQKKHKDFSQVYVYATFTQAQGLHLVFLQENEVVKRDSILPGSLDLTPIFQKRYSRYEITEECASQIEIWLKMRVNGQYPDVHMPSN